MTRETLPQSEPATTLPKIFASRKVQNHMRRMYTIGTDMRQESAFAVYNTKGRMTPSNLYVPTPTAREVGDEESARRRYMSVDMSKLVCKEVYKDDEIWSVGHELSESAKQTIAGITASFDLSEYDKDDLITEVELRDRLKMQTGTTASCRHDIAMAVHNHPRSHGIYEGVNSLLYPSGTDVTNHQRLAQHNLGLVEGIVGSDGERHGIILYAAEAGRDQDPEAYDAHIDYERGEKYNLRQLGRFGYVHTILSLNDNGILMSGEKTALGDFAKQVKI
jgi:hypothetical protein